VRVVFIHGAFSRDGGWWWSEVAALLARDGIESTAAPLPSCGEAGSAPTGAGPSLAEDAAETKAILDDRTPTILVAHSYGGMVAAEVGDHPAVQRIVYISSYLPVVGESLGALTASPDPVPIVPHADGSISVDAGDRAAFDARFLNDVADPDLVSGAHERLCAQSAAVFGAEASNAAWERVPSTYLVCAEDKSTSPDLQRAQASRATSVRELSAAHFPFLSRPDLIATCVGEVAAAD
jgi:pimeloyl-ACP methyl ester carboxylesterase